MSVVTCSIPDGTVLDAACPECGHKVGAHARIENGLGICGMCSTIEQQADSMTGELLSFEPELTGVIVGAPSGVTHEMAGSMVETLRARFPGVEFAVVPGVSSVAFRYSKPEPEVE